MPVFAQFRGSPVSRPLNTPLIDPLTHPKLATGHAIRPDGPFTLLCFQVRHCQHTMDTMLYMVVIIGILYASVGIVGNVLSAIVWIRRRASSSAIYLAALAITDAGVVITFPIVTIIPTIVLQYLARTILVSLILLEPLLVLGFSVERLYAIRRPLQVSFYITYTYYTSVGLALRYVRLSHQRSYSTSNPVSTEMGDRSREYRLDM